MYTYLYSKWSDKGRLILSATNGVADMYELLGLFTAYSSDSAEHSNFASFYNRYRDTRPFHFRNIGERRLKKRLQEHGLYVPRRNLRLLAYTRSYIPIIASSDMGIIFSELVSLIYESEQLKITFQNLYSQRTPGSILTFQYDFLYEYISVKACIVSTKKNKKFSEILKNWEANPVFS